MSKKKRLLPFKALPASWGLSGKTFERAKIEYELDGIDRDIALISLDLTGKDLVKKLLEIDRKYDRIDDEAFERSYNKADFIGDDEAMQLVDIEIDFKYNKIKETEYNKRKATLKQESWVDVVALDFDAKSPTGNIPFKLDWNEYFLIELRVNGYSGVSDEHMVQGWLSELCAKVAIESGILNEDGEQMVTSIRRDDGRIEYS